MTDKPTDAVALARYKVVPAHESMFHRFAVVAGDGKQQLYLGREVECENMARKFAGAFLDGAFYQANITPPTQSADSVTAPARGETYHLGACIVDGVLSATVMSKERGCSGAVTVLLSEQIPVEYLQDRDVIFHAIKPNQAAESVLEDAARYRWLAEHCRSTSEHWGGRWSIIIDGPAPKSHDSEDDFDAAVDAARKQGATP